MILTFDTSGKLLARGSGVIISEDGTVITNHHVVEGADSIVVLPTDEREQPSTSCSWFIGSFRSNVDVDLALLEPDNALPCSVHGIQLDTVLPPTGTDIQVLGYPAIAVGGLNLTVTRGQIAGRVSGNNGGIQLLKTDAKIISGTSGGPVIGNNGKLTGIVTAFTYLTNSFGQMDPSQETIGLIIPSTIISQFAGGDISFAGRSQATQEKTIREGHSAYQGALDTVVFYTQLAEDLRSTGLVNYCALLQVTKDEAVGLAEFIMDMDSFYSSPDGRAAVDIYTNFATETSDKWRNECLHVTIEQLLPSDVPSSAWFAYELAAMNFLGGMMDDPFRPADKATRGELIKLLVNMIETEEMPQLHSNPTFDDVPDYLEVFFEKAKINGWISGDNNCVGGHPCNARPNDPINRAEAAAIIIRAFGLVSNGSPVSFSDASVGQWFSSHINTAASLCILQGDEGTTLVRPADPVNRAELIMMAFRASEDYAGKRLMSPDCEYKKAPFFFHDPDLDTRNRF